jgi:hypothetical protein
MNVILLDMLTNLYINNTNISNKRESGQRGEGREREREKDRSIER